MGELSKSSPDPDFASRRLCTAPHQVQEGDPRVQEGYLLLEEYGGWLEGDFPRDHLDMPCRDTGDLQENCISYIYIFFF